jgi:hypothetical protein
MRFTNFFTSELVETLQKNHIVFALNLIAFPQNGLKMAFIFILKKKKSSTPRLFNFRTSDLNEALQQDPLDHQNDWEFFIFNTTDCSTSAFLI